MRPRHTLGIIGGAPTYFADEYLGLYNHPIPASPTIASYSAAAITEFNGWGNPDALVLDTYNTTADYDVPYVCSNTFTTGTADTAADFLCEIASADGTISYAGSTADGIRITNVSVVKTS